MRSIIITHDSRGSSRARSVIVVFHLISVPAIVGPRRSRPACARRMRVSRGRVIELVYLAGPARASEERRARPIVAMPRGFAIHQRHVNAFRCWFAAGVITLFIKFHHPRASAAARARSRLAPAPITKTSGTAVYPEAPFDSPSSVLPRCNPALRWCTRLIVYLRVAWLSITVSHSGHTRLPQIMVRYRAVNTKLVNAGVPCSFDFFVYDANKILTRSTCGKN